MAEWALQDNQSAMPFPPIPAGATTEADHGRFGPKQVLVISVAAATAICWIVAIVILDGLHTIHTFGGSVEYYGSAGITAIIVGLVYFGIVRLVRSIGPPRGELKELFDNLTMNERNWWGWLIVALIIAAPISFLPGNAFLSLNQSLDPSEGKDASYLVRIKTETHGKSGYRWEVGFLMERKDAPAAGAEESVRVPSRMIYDGIMPGRTQVVLKMHPGAFGLPWTTDEPKWR